LLLALPAQAGRLSESDMAAMIMPPMSLGAKDSALPVWTLLSGGGEPMGYVFETADLAPLPGFAGVPIDMLVLMDKDGRFLDLRLLEQSEPVFVDGLGPQPLIQFIRQYVGKTVAMPIKVAAPGSPHEGVTVDGIAKATASTGIVNQTILAAGLKVARERLAGAAPKAATPPKKEVLATLDWDGLVAAGLVQHLRVTEAEAERAFGNTGGGDDAFIDLWAADLGVPTVAAALLTDDTLKRLRAHVREYEEPILLLADGSHSLTGETFVRNGVPDRLLLRQDKFPISLRDADVEVGLKPGIPARAQSLVLRADMRLGFDPSSPWTLSVREVRRQGSFLASAEARDFPITYTPVDGYYQDEAVVPEERPAWVQAWIDRKWEIAALLALLAALTVGLARQRLLAARLEPARLAVLAVSLGFVGWYGQGQLSIVNVLAVVHGQGLGSMLYDPFSVILWVYVAVAAPFWGRGPFCGWLCPFGALQELTARLARLARIPERKLPAALDRRLEWLKYGVLAALVASAAVGSAWTDRLVEVEPFKTSITLAFHRSWPFVAYAALVLAAGAVVYKGFCRYVCPLGAAMAVIGKVRRLDHISRRAECGSPCQICFRRCRYGAIARSGAIDYDECVQCLDCVALHDDAKTCLPLALAAKKGAPR
jgi:transcriptional regulator of nitric oxide reductase